MGEPEMRQIAAWMTRWCVAADAGLHERIAARSASCARIPAPGIVV